MTFRPKTLAVIALTLVLLGVLAGVAGPALAAEPRIYEITDVSFASVNEQVKITFRVRVNELGSAFPETVTIERSDTAGAFLNPPVAVLKVGREIPAEPGLHTVTWTDAGVEVGKTYHYKLNGKTFTNAVTVRSKDDEAPPAEPGPGPGEEAGTGETPGGSVGGGILSNAIGWLFIKLWEAVDGLFGLRDIEQWVFGTGPAAADHLHVVPPIRWPAVKLAHDTLSAIAWLFLGLATPLLGLRLLYSNLDPADRYSLLDIGKGLVIFVAVLGFGMTFFKVAADLSYAVLGEMHKAFHFEGDLIRTLAGGIRNMTAASIAGGYLASGLLLVTLALATVWVNVIYILRQITLCVCLATMPVFAFFAVFPFTRGIFVHYVRYTLATLMVPLFHAVILALFLGTLHGGAEPGTQAADFARAFGGPLQALMVLFAMIPLGSLPYMLVG
ncbi:MAG: type IV secretion system protein, partial [Desulfotomaculales bacterium]